MTGQGPGSAPGPDTERESNAGSDTERKSDAGSDANRRGERERDSGTSSIDVTVEAPSVEVSEDLAAWWVALADEQRAYGSHLLGEPNRALIREAMTRHVVTDGLLVARVSPQERDTGADDDADGASEEDADEETWAPRSECGGTWEPGLGGDDAIGTPARTGAESDERPPTSRGGRAGPGDRIASTGERTAPDRPDRTDDGTIVGFVMFGPETGSYEQSVDRGIIENVYVHPDYRNLGVGKALLDAAECALAESGVDTIALEAMATNNAARRLYARRGYQPHRVELEAPVKRLAGVKRAENDRADEHSIDSKSNANRSSEGSADAIDRPERSKR